jgi:hypothetical protein
MRVSTKNKSFVSRVLRKYRLIIHCFNFDQSMSLFDSFLALFCNPQGDTFLVLQTLAIPIEVEVSSVSS